ncbi:MAG: DUF2382 domain-containing protein [Actinophytocola sp.]|uniref:DUF2382 domain-containing protein n=1 Tax=Actinophytocola sp. TaxID=1872138 RepID=UPI003D6A6782
MIGQNMIDRLYDCQVVDPRGEKIGSVKQVWLDGQTGDPVWASVHTGLFGLKETFVPLQRAEMHDDQVQVSVPKEQVKDAPRIEAAGDRMSEADQAALYQHYGVAGPGNGGRGAGGRGNGGPGNGGRAGRPGEQQPPGGGRMGQQGGRMSGDLSGRHARSGHETAMTRSEERLKVGTEQVETGRVRLVKHVVTENQQVTVPVSHEEVHLEREPITDGKPGQRLADGEQEMRLHAERPVVDKEAVAVEKVRLAKDTVTDEETVRGDVRKERIDVDDPAGRLGKR